MAGKSRSMDALRAQAILSEGKARVQQVPANVRLRAAAPELLVACERLLAVIEQLMPGVGNISCSDYAELNDAPIAARAAIAKAKGG